jgi:hypothetical protein
VHEFVTSRVTTAPRRRARPSGACEATADPVKRYLEIEKLHQVGKPPPWLMTDKPWDEGLHTGKEVPVTVRIPPLDRLVPDTSYFDAIAASPIHGGVLDAIRDDYP